MYASRGFTLIELMVGIAMVAILTALAAPSFDKSIKNMRVTSVSDQLISALSTARAEAVKRGRYVTICPSSNGTSCSGTNWGVGYLVAEEPNTATASSTPAFQATSSNDQRIKVYEATPSTVSISLASGASFLRFDTLGANGSAAVQTFTVNNSTCAGYSVRQVVLTVSGHPAVQSGTCP